jgi:putative redox protein
MKASVHWSGKMSFEGRSASGHRVMMDGSPDIGGENRGPRPMEMLLLGLGGCSSIDVMLILNKGRQDVTDCVVHIDAERAPAEPKVFTKIHMHFVVSGRQVDPKRVEKAIQLSAEKYCSASIMLGKTAQMSHDFEIVEVA